MAEPLAPRHEAAPLLAVRDLVVEFSAGWGRPATRGVDSVSFDVPAGKTVGVVGESGSGKSTIGRAILGLVRPASGQILFDSKDITSASNRERLALSRDIQVVFQDPYSSLNPTRTIGQTLAETLQAQSRRSKQDVQLRVSEILEQVGLPRDAGQRYPASFSGGQRQRIAIARALIAKPRLVICDEPLSALDLSIQAQVINLLKELQLSLGLSYVFVAHDLAVVRYIAHEVVVLYRGRVMESGPVEVVYADPAHPYTVSLLDAAPIPDPNAQSQRRDKRASSPATTDATPPIEGCPFAPRCLFASEVCWRDRPKLETTPAGGTVACHRWGEIAQARASSAAHERVG